MKGIVKMMKKLLELMLGISILMNFSTAAFAANEKDYEEHGGQSR